MQNNRFALRRFLPIVAVIAVLAAIVAGMLLRRNALKEGTILPTSGVGESDSSASNAPIGADPPKQRIARRPLSPMPAGPKNGQRAAYVRERRENIIKASGERNKAFLKEAKAKFQSEKVDPVWSSQAEARLQSIVSPEQLAAYGVSVQEMKVECKSTRCRINSTFSSSSQADDWTILYMSNVGENLPHSFLSTNTLPDGRVQIEIYGTGRR